MNSKNYDPRQVREVFHLEFLRWFTRKLDGANYALKGGVNLRLFFRSFRYSEDIDIDVQSVRIEKIQKTVLEILEARGFSDNLKSFGVERVVPPDISTAKQTKTTQRFKMHLITSGGEDFFTKIEFSRRGLTGSRLVEPVSVEILRSYKMAPFLVSHYTVDSAIGQKIQALAHRPVLQARDIFDLFILSSQCDKSWHKNVGVGTSVLKKAHDNIFLVDYRQFQDTVAAYLAFEDQKTYALPAVWDEIKLKTAHFLEEAKLKDENI